MKRLLGIMAVVALLASVVQAADVPTKVVVLDYAEVTLAAPGSIELTIPDDAKYYGPSGESQAYGGYLHMTVEANYSAKVSFGCTAADVVQAVGDKTGADTTTYPYAKVTKGTDLLGVLPAIGKGFWSPGGAGVTSQWAPWDTWTAGDYVATIPGTRFPDPLPVGANNFTLYIAASLRQTPTGAYAPAGDYTGTLLVTVAP